MLGLAEYVAAAAELDTIGSVYEDELRAKLTGLTKRDAIKLARLYVPIYQRDYRALLDRTLRDIAATAVDHYADHTGVSLDRERLVEELIRRTYNERYYGATLTARLNIAQKQLERRIVQTAQVSPDKLSTIFTESVPFGAQNTISKRLLLGQAAKIENDTAKEMAARANIDLIRWTLSHRHATPDVCDDYSRSVSRNVVRLLDENNIEMDPKGLYLRDELPPPPHPNCQCEYAFTDLASGSRVGAVRRSIRKVRRILRQLRGGR